MPEAGRRFGLGTLVAGGLVIGVLDMSAALTVWCAFRGIQPVRIPQSIASGLLGPDAFTGGVATAVLGTVLHFFIAFCAAGTFLLAASRWPALAEKPWLSGPAFGVVWYALMYHVVLPLSRVRKTPFVWSNAALNVGIHVFCVGLPVALVAWRARRRV